jgi:hypothetical protein
MISRDVIQSTLWSEGSTPLFANIFKDNKSTKYSDLDGLVYLILVQIIISIIIYFNKRKFLKFNQLITILNLKLTLAHDKSIFHSCYINYSSSYRN